MSDSFQYLMFPGCNQHTYVLWKESLNGDGHQFHQYQQNEQSPLILTQKRPWHMMLEIQALACNCDVECVLHQYLVKGHIKIIILFMKLEW